MENSRPPVSVARQVFPETTASVIDGMHDLLASVDRDWGAIMDGKPDSPRRLARSRWATA